jgi:hypothetical protein
MFKAILICNSQSNVTFQLSIGSRGRTGLEAGFTAFPHREPCGVAADPLDQGGSMQES